MSVKFNQESARDYEFANGRKPRGKGYWAFGLGRNGAWTTVWYNGMLTEAKKLAMREARSLGCDTVTLYS
jgi:hypothetical protein